MQKPSIENLEALARGVDLNIYQKALAKNELMRLKNYVYELEQSNLPNRDTSNPDDLIFNPVCNCHGSGVNSFSGHCDRCGLPKKELK